jgi:ABC-2 type transport system ATP-binding protein
MSDAAIETERLTKVFRPPLARLRRWLGRPTREVTAVEEVGLRVAQGEIFGLVGRNGQGKTTLLKMISALIRPTSGRVRVFGHDVERRPESVKLSIGLVTSEERSFYYRLTGRQNLMFFARLYDLPEREARRRIGALADLLDAGDQLDRRYQELSSGNRQRVALARALLNDPPLLLLDEPTRSLDPLAAEELRGLIRTRMNREQGKTIFITSHNLAEVEDLCGRVGILHRGRLRMCAPMEELRRQYADRERIVLQLRGPGDAVGPNLLGGEAAGLECARVGDGRWEVRFTRRAGDDTLDRVIARARAAGARVEACQTMRSGLLDLMASLEEPPNVDSGARG